MGSHNHAQFARSLIWFLGGTNFEAVAAHIPQNVLSASLFVKHQTCNELFHEFACRNYAVHPSRFVWRWLPKLTRHTSEKQRQNQIENDTRC